MSDTNCKHHIDHENRLKNLEVGMKELKNNQMNPAIWVALLSFCGTIGTVIGQVLIHYIS